MSSIKRRLIVTLGVLLCLLWGAGSFTAYLGMRAVLISEFDVALKADAQALINMAEESENQFKFDSTGELMPEFDRERRPEYFQLWLPDGSTLHRSPGLALENGELPRRGGTLQTPQFWNLTLPDGMHGRAIGIQFTPKLDDDAPPTPGMPRPRGPVTLVTAFHRSDLDRQLHQLGILLLLTGAAMAASTVIVVSLVVRRGLKPLATLAERAEKIDASSLQLRFPLDHAPAELLPIGHRLNDLLSRLEASFARERRFSADVAHELRTPIAELRALTEIALKWPDDIPATQSALKDSLNIALQMESIATRLLALVRCEDPLSSAAPKPVSIVTLLEEIFQPFASKVRAKRLALTVDLSNKISWLADPPILRSIITNLVSNAVDHSPVDGSIRVRTETDDQGDRLLISNTTSNLTTADLPHLFERFWRKDSARTDNVHSGLGLPLAYGYAKLIGCQLSADLTGRNEITFTLDGLRRLAPTDNSAYRPDNLAESDLVGSHENALTTEG